MSVNYMVCRKCRRHVDADYQGTRCPLCGEETVFDRAISVVDKLPQGVRDKVFEIASASQTWRWSVPYVAVVVAATLGSIIFCVIPGWGFVAGAICTIVSTFAGFRAGMLYHEVVRLRPS